MGYIDDKARDADNTIKGVGIVVVIVIVLCVATGSIEGGLWAFVGICGAAMLGLIIWGIYKHNERKSQERAVEQKKNEELELGIKRYNARIQEIGFDKTGKQKIWAKYSNDDDFYIDYIWKENDKIWRVLAEPDEHTFNMNPDYENLANIKKLYMNISDINYIAIEGNYCMLYIHWKPMGFRKDAINIFREMVPEKIK